MDYPLQFTSRQANALNRKWFLDLVQAKTYCGKTPSLSNDNGADG
jgi:hypothetical protein